MRIEWSKGAERNLDSIETFIAQDNPTAAANTVLKIVRRVPLSNSPSSLPVENLDGLTVQEN